jgi:hypothetical protein
MAIIQIDQILQSDPSNARLPHAEEYEGSAAVR